MTTRGQERDDTVNYDINIANMWKASRWYFKHVLNKKNLNPYTATILIISNIKLNFVVCVFNDANFWSC